MPQQECDGGSLPVSFLLLAFAIPAACWATWRMLATPARFPCACTACRHAAPRRSRHALFVAAALWAVVAMLGVVVATTHFVPARTAFNPLEILEVAEDAPLAVIKKAHRMKVRRLQRTGGASKAGLADLNKAFEMLKKPELYRAWLFSSTERKQGLALPHFLVRPSAPVCGVYVALLAILVVFLAQHRAARARTHMWSGVQYASTEAFLEAVDSFSSNEALLVPQLIFFLSRCGELARHRWASDLSGRKKSLEEAFALPLMSDDPAYLHIYAYLCRAPGVAPEDSAYVKDTGMRLCTALRGVAVVCRAKHLLAALLTLHKMFVQAVPAPAYALLQYPGVSVERLLSDPRAIKAPAPGLLNTILEGRDLKEALHLNELIPRVEIADLTVRVEGDVESSPAEEDAVPTPESTDISLTPGRTPADKKGTQPKDAFVIAKNAVPTVSFALQRLSGLPACHSPFPPSATPAVPGQWLVFCRVNGQLHGDTRVVDASEARAALSFALPCGDGRVDVRVAAVHTGYFCADVEAGAVIRFE